MVDMQALSFDLAAGGVRCESALACAGGGVPLQHLCAEGRATSVNVCECVGGEAASRTADSVERQTGIGSDPCCKKNQATRETILVTRGPLICLVTRAVHPAVIAAVIIMHVSAHGYFCQERRQKVSFLPP